MKYKVCLILPGGDRRKQLWHKHSEQVAADLGCEFHFTPETSTFDPSDWSSQIGDVDAIITSWGAPRLTEDVLPKTDRLKVIAHAAGSVSPIVSDAIFDRGIILLSANRIMARSVAEYCLTMTLVGLRRLTENAQFGANLKTFKTFTDHQLTGIDQATIGVWGFGDVAKHLIQLLKGVGVKNIVVHSDFLEPDQADELGIQKVDFDQMFEMSDVVHMCESLRDETLERVTAKQLGLLKNQAVLVNAGRAKLVHEADLLSELKRNRIFGIFDVHYVEPLPEDSPFRRLENVVLTPHIAGPAGRSEYTSVMLREIVKVLNGQSSEYEISAQRAGVMTSNQLTKSKGK